jgi:hypothetical protein
MLEVAENRALRRIFGPKWDEIIRGWRTLHSEELHNCNCSPNIIGMIKSRRMIWDGHITCMGKIGIYIYIYIYIWFLWESQKERDN